MVEEISKDAFLALSKRVDTLEGHLKENTEATKRIESNTKDIVETFQALSGGFKVLNGLGALAKPVWRIAGAGAAIAALWTAIKSVGFFR
jgi:hypothetical protein